MPTIAVVSPCGGAGRSTLTACLATLAARSGVWGLAVECDPQNLLALHFGADSAPADLERCDAYLARQPLRQHVVYQPASRYWAFQILEAVSWLAIAVALAGFCTWRIRRPA